MDEIQVKAKQWADAITQERLNGIVDELEDVLHDQAPRTKNKVIFKLLLYLTHTAGRCDKSTKNAGLEIWRLANWICSNMIEVVDKKKFIASIYHITKSLLDMGLYKEALDICNYILPSQMLIYKCSNDKDMYFKVSQLLQQSTLQLLETSKLESREHYETLITMIKYELNLIKLAHPSNWRHLMSRLLCYCKKMRAIVDESARVLKEEFVDTMLTYVSQQKIDSEDENKEQTYRYMCLLVTEMILNDVDKLKNCSTTKTSSRYFKAFRNFTKNCQSYVEFFKLYERLSNALVRPFEDLSSKTAETIDACAVETQTLINLYGHGDALRWYSYSSIFLLTELLGYWDKFAKIEKYKCTTDCWMLSMMIFLDEQSNIFNRYEITDCSCRSTTKCSSRYDAYNSLSLRLKGLSVASRFFDSRRAIVTEKFCSHAVEFAAESLIRIAAVKKNQCKLWSILWSACGACMYNIAVACETKYHDKSVRLYKLLLQSVIDFEGRNFVHSDKNSAPTISSIREPLFTFLHRLTSVYHNHGMYQDARVICCINGLLSSRRIPTDVTGNKKIEEYKSYVCWTNIQLKYEQSRGQTMLDYFRCNQRKIAKIIDIKPNDYDPIEVCLREIKALANAPIDLSSSMIPILDEMERLRATPADYALGVQLLGRHLLNLETQFSIGRYLSRATMGYERENNPNPSFKLCYGHIKFYEFYQKLNDTAAETEIEMKSGKLALKSSGENDRRDLTTTNHEPKKIVPVYTTINMSVTMSLASALERALTLLTEVTDSDDHPDKLNDWEIAQTLEIAMVAGEYARFYHLENLEISAWKLSNKLARRTNDHRSIIYTTMRSLTSQRIDVDWIDEANKSIEIIRNSDDVEDKRIIDVYNVCLAEFYCQNGKQEIAKKIFVSTMDKILDSFVKNSMHLLLSVQLRMNHSSMVDEKDDQSNYTRMIVYGLYTILSVDESTNVNNTNDHRTKQLWQYDVIFEFTYNMAFRMNSLLSFHEISAHLIRRLNIAQKFGAALRVAECLKSLCYIDLSRAKLDDCEVKLQGLEHILETEDFENSMGNKFSIDFTCDKKISPTSSSLHYVVEAVRDAGQNDASPVLQSKIFADPIFVVHDDKCGCFKCTNKRYQSLVFGATHLRAQLFALRRNGTAALQHFEGALTIKKNILTRAKIVECSEDDSSEVLKNYRHLDVVEYVLFHLDYCRFIKWYMPERTNDGIEIALEARRLCSCYNLENHPIYASVNQLLFEYRFDKLYSNGQFSNFTVPPIDQIDVGPYVNESRIDPTLCTTPIREAVMKKSYSVRRRKVPAFLNIEKVPIDLDDDKSPIAETSSTSARTRRVGRRRITETQESNVPEATNQRDSTKIPKISFTIPNDEELEKIVDDAPKRASETVRKKRVNFVETSESESSDIDCQTKNGSRTRGKTTKTTKTTTQASRSTRSRSNGNVVASGKNIDEAATPPIVTIDEVTELIDEMKITRESTSIISERASRGSRKTTNFTKISDVGTITGDDVIPVEVRRSSSRLKGKTVKM